MSKLKLKLSLLLTATLLFFISCRKSDEVSSEKPPLSAASNHAKKFFTIPAETQPSIVAIAKELERRNNIKEFVNDFAETKGFPVWNKAILSFSDNNPNNNFGSSGGSGDSLVYIPLVLQNATSSNGFLRAVINDSISLSYCLAKDYKNYSFTPSTNITTADEFASLFMVMDKEVFGQNKFYLTDSRLLTGTGIANGTQNRIAKILSVTNGTRGNNLCEGTIYTVSWLVQDAANCTCANGASTPGGVCHDWETGCQACSNTVTITITVGDDPGCGGTGSGGGTPIGGGPSGGGSGGGAPPPYYPCQNIPTALLPEPLPPCPPPTGGSGWSSLVSYLAVLLNLTTSQADFLNQNPIYQQPIYNYITQNSSSQSVQICKDHMDFLIAEPEYVQFVNNHNSTGNPSVVWWTDDVWLDNPQYFSLTPGDDYYKLTAAEKALTKQYPTAAFIMGHFNRPMENNFTIQKFGSNGLNDKSDALRHAFFQAVNTVRVGASLTQQFSNAHETEVPAQLIKEKQMDLFNNSIGIAYGQTQSYPASTPAMMANAIYIKVLNGEMQYLSPIWSPMFNTAGQIVNPVGDPNFYGTNGSNNAATATHGITASTLLIPTNQ